jgi:hypothetical protein
MRSVFVLVLLLAAAPAAASCPTTPVAEAGGSHWCYSDGKRGNVHLWTPGNFAAKTAVTVVYAHGHDVDASPRGSPHYVDFAWTSHGLAAQFEKSGLNALFVAVEGPLNDRQKVKWTSLGSLLSSVKDKGGIRPPRRVVAVAHSAGIFTVMRFLDDARLVHVVALDALYQDSPKRLARWYRGAAPRRLTLVGAQSVGWRTARLARKLGCRATGPCAVTIDAKLGHMDVVTAGRTIPAALAKVIPTPPPKAKPKPKKRRP